MSNEPEGGIGYSLKDYEKLINKLPCVISSRIITDDRGEISEVHVLSDIRRNPKQVSRDIQSAILSKYDIKINYKIISVAQIEGEGLMPKDFRFNLRYIEIHTEGLKASAEVAILKGEDILRAVATGGNSFHGRLRLISQATLQNIHTFLGSEYVFTVADLNRQQIAGYDSITVAISHFINGSEEILLGSSIIKNDPNEAVARATLDAINRRLSIHFNN